jgi:hypothetical protein
MTNRQAAQETRNVTVCEFLLVPANATIYTANVAFSTIATKMQTDSDAAVVAGNDAAANNSGYSLDKDIAKEAASQVAAQTCASSKVKLDLLGNNAISNSLHGAATYYSTAKDAICGNRLMNAYNVMHTNLAMITTDYLTTAQLATLLTKINTYTDTKGSSSLVNNNSPVLTSTYATAIKLTSKDVATIKELAKFYKTTHPLFYNGIMKACKMPGVTVRHTPVIITITDASTTGVLAGVAGTLTKSKEIPVSNVAGLMTYATVLSGSATATLTKTGFITDIRTLNIVRGKSNSYSVALVPGVMTAEQVTAINTTLAQAIADDKAAIVAKKKARKAAIEATAAAKLIVEPVVEAVADVVTVNSG